MLYFLAIDGVKSDGLTRFQILERIERGEVEKSTLAWVQGMEEWGPLGEFSEFDRVFDPPAPIAEESESGFGSGAKGGDAAGQQSAAAGGAAAGKQKSAPWLRLFARGVDFILLFLGFQVLFAFLMPGLGTEIAASFTAQLITHSAMILVGCFIEALFLSTWGFTPGKALFQVIVRDEEGKILGYKTALQRAVLVWVKGLALMIVPITPITMMIAHARLMFFGSTSWDRELRLRVTYGRPNQVRIVMAVAIYAAFAYLIFQAVQFHFEQTREEAPKEGEGEPEEEENEEEKKRTFPDDLT